MSGKEDLQAQALGWAAWCERRGMSQLEAFLRFISPTLVGQPPANDLVRTLSKRLMDEKIEHQKLRAQIFNGEFYSRDEMARLIIKFLDEMSMWRCVQLIFMKMFQRRIKP